MSKISAATAIVGCQRQPVSRDDHALPAHPYAGMWITADGQIRHELLPNCRYIEARGTKERAYQGRYEISGRQILYWDDTGFTADGEFVETDVLHHTGMVLHRTG